MTTRAWTPDYRCCWCGEIFVQRVVHAVKAWVCPTEACYDRQVSWKLLDRFDKLMYLPMPRQVEVEEAVASQQYGAICLGGDRSGGKSIGFRMLLYRYARSIESFTALLLRRTFPELELNHLRFMDREAERLGASWNGTKKILTFETGGTIRAGHCFKPHDYEDLIGGDVDAIFFGQLEEFTEQQFVEISPSTGRIRRDNWRGVVLAEENPGGPLSAFVKTFFIDKNPDPALYPNYCGEDHHFIASKLDDNPWTDPRYVHKLANLAPERRAMFRFGDRSTFPGKFFRFDEARHVSA